MSATWHDAPTAPGWWFRAHDKRWSLARVSSMAFELVVDIDEPRPAAELEHDGERWFGPVNVTGETP